MFILDKDTCNSESISNLYMYITLIVYIRILCIFIRNIITYKIRPHNERPQSELQISKRCELTLVPRRKSLYYKIHQNLL